MPAREPRGRQVLPGVWSAAGAHVRVVRDGTPGRREVLQGVRRAGGHKYCRAIPTPAPDSYTPKHLAEKIINSKAALEGERKQVTVLFADLKGSMELLADRDPEEARKLLDPVLEQMMEAVHRYEGTVNQVMGDGIMALFGAPLAHEDHAVRACYAALRMQESVKRYAEGVRREQGVTIRIRVGLNSGEVVVRAIGSDLHMDYTAVGQTTHLAARMEQLAEPGSILLSPATLELAEGFIEVKPLGPLAVKGLPEPVEVCELVAAGAVRSRCSASTTCEQRRQLHLSIVITASGDSRGYLDPCPIHPRRSWSLWGGRFEADPPRSPAVHVLASFAGGSPPASPRPPLRCLAASLR